MVFFAGCIQQPSYNFCELADCEHGCDPVNERCNAPPENNSDQSQTPNNQPSENPSTSYSGTVIAGDTTKYIRFSQLDYDKAVEDENVIYLYFYATWCPICKAERPTILDAFEEMSYQDVVGFEVHYNDDETIAEDREVAKKFGVSYQHTTIILDKDGNEFFRSLSPISKEMIKSNIESARRV